MIALCCVAAMGADSLGGRGTSVRSSTAETPASGNAVVRWPLGRSELGLTDRDALWITPFDLGIGGPRVGWERGFALGDTRWSLSPSVGVDTSLARGSVRLESNTSWDLGAHQLTAQLGLDARVLRQLVLDDGQSRRLSTDRLQAHALGVWDSPHARVKLRLPLLDRGDALDWGSVSLAYTTTSRRSYVAAGLGLLAGRPNDRYTLGDYQWWFWLPYPELDLVVRL